MIKSLDEILTRTILSCIPKNVKALKYLMDILGIGRESVYRRLKGNIPFTFEEIVKLSATLNFSIDEIVESEMRNRGSFVDYHQKNMQSPEKYFYTSHLNFYNLLQSIVNAKEVEVLLSLNRIFSFFVVDFDILFKFYYYMWLHQFSDRSFNSNFSEIQLPSQIIAVQQKIKEKISKVKNISFIFDRFVLLKLIQELQYFHSRKLLSVDELMEIKNDIVGFLNCIEKCIQVGSDDNLGSTCHFYLSLLNIDMNSVYGTIDGNVISQSWTCANASQNIGNSDLIASHKNWIHSLKRSSILISHSNETAQASFLNQQRNNIDMITNDLFLYYG